jgi:hypothetical protein
MERFGTSGFAEFDRLASLFRQTRELLDALTATGDLPDGGSEVLATQTLPHVEDMEAGFRVWLRAGEAELADLREFVARAGMRLEAPHGRGEHRAALIEAMQALAGAGGERSLAPPPARRLAALEHARLVFALMPRTPASDVHFPAGLRSYADIAAPRTPAELAERIEELERSLWTIATGLRPRLSDGRYRRTYGFFDTAANVSGRGFRLS